MKKLDLQSKNIVDENITKLKEIFPDAFCEDKIDFDVLSELLGEHVIEGQERFQFTWSGKADARREAMKRSRGTLLPSKEDSKDWENTENIYIEGDNLEVLKLLQKSYHSKIKMIYIDPPYNTGKDFVYKDNYIDNLKNYLEISGQKEDGKKISTNSDSHGRYHSNWLNMMYPRLKLARNLLKDDGVIFISIDDNEVANLRKTCDEIFGEDNFVALLPTIMNLKGNNDQYAFSGTHEYTIVYTKNYSMSTFYEFYISDEEINDWDIDEYGLFKKGANLKATGINAPRYKRPNLFFPLYIDDENKVSLTKLNDTYQEVLPITDNEEMSWRWSKEKFESELHNLIVINNNNKISIYKKQRSKDNDIPTKKPKSIFIKPEYSSGNGTQIIKTLFNEKVFDFPKPISLIYDFLTIGTRNNDIVLDFFSGSATTAHSIMQLNAEDSGNRKFILVQLPELTDNKVFSTICELGKERINISGQKILDDNKKEKNPKDLSNLDVGFKVFKLESSNIKTWDPDPENLEKSLQESMNNIKDDRSEEDLLYEILLHYGLELTLPIEEYDICGQKVFDVGYGALVVCLGDNINIQIVDGIAKLTEELNPDEDIRKYCRVVFKDNGFESDTLKTNTIQNFKRIGIDEVVSV